MSRQGPRSIAALLSLIAWTSAGARQPATRAPSAPPALAARVDSIFAGPIRSDGPGCAVGVYRDGALLLAKGYGVASIEHGRPITPRTVFNLGSVSKQFTALAALMLESQRRVSLDDDVRRYVPELRDSGTRIRIRDLLQHTSGLRDYVTLEELSGRETATMGEFLDLLASQRALNFTPGTQHEYSHSDFVLLALIVERVTGEPFGRYLEREVFLPLGMTGSRVDDARGMAVSERAYGHIGRRDGYRVQFPASQLIGGQNVYTSVEDLYRWNRNFDDGAVGGRAMIARMLERPKLAAGDTIPYAFGLRQGTYRGLRTVYRGGNDHGTRTEIIRFPEHRFAVATLCNGEHLPPGELGQRVADLYLGGAMQPRRPQAAARPTVALTAAELSRYVGVYRSPEAVDLVRIAIRNGKLAELLGDTAQTLTHVGGGRFSADGSPDAFLLTFSQPATGAMRLEYSFDGEVSGVVERVADSALWRPNPVTLAQYAGSYFSNELDASWQLVPRDTTLVLRRRGLADHSLVPIQRDMFAGAFGNWAEAIPARFELGRNAAGEVTHFTVSTGPGEGSVRNLRFVRLASR